MELIRTRVEGGLCEITLADPARGNALRPRLMEELAGAVAAAAARPECRAIVLGAEGGEFCRGLDLEEAFGGGRRPGRSFFAPVVQALLALREVPLPVLGCVDGPVAGGGVALVSACDVVVASATATFQLPEAVIGLVPYLGLTFLERRMAPGRAAALALSSRRFSASEALAAGLIDEVAVDAPAAAAAQVRRLLRSSPRSLAEIKRFAEPPLRGGVHTALERLMGWLDDPATVEAVAAFSRGETPPWSLPA